MSIPIIASSASDAVTGTADTSLAVTAPTGTAVGDLLLAFISTEGIRNYTPPAGWTTILNKAATAHLYIFGKIAEAGDVGATLTFTASGTFNSGRLWVARITGGPAAIGSVIVDAGPGSSGNDTTAESANVTTLTTDNLILYAIASYASSSSLAGWTEEHDADDANTRQLGVYSNPQASPATVTGPTISISFNQWCTGGVAIPPATATGNRRRRVIIGGGVL
jgi:hypothetical protein